MSINGSLVCIDCQRNIDLGKALFRSDRSVRTYAASAYPSLFDYKTHSRAVYKFLADHTGHDISVVLEHDFAKLIGEDEHWISIGGETVGDVSFEDYLKDWDGYPKW